MNVLTNEQIKRRGIAAEEEALRKGPVHLVKRNRPAAVVLSEGEYSRLTARAVIQSVSQSVNQAGAQFTVMPALAASSARAWLYSASSRSTRSATLSIALTAPMPWPEPQMSFQALASVLPPDPKFIAEGSLTGRFSGSSPALTIEGRR